MSPNDLVKRTDVCELLEYVFTSTGPNPMGSAFRRLDNLPSIQLPPKIFYIVLNVDNGMERLQWAGYVYADNADDAFESVRKQKFDGDIVSLKYIIESHPINGMILHE